MYIYAVFQSHIHAGNLNLPDRFHQIAPLLNYWEVLREKTALVRDKNINRANSIEEREKERDR